MEDKLLIIKPFPMALLFIWIIFCLVIGVMGENRTVGFWGAFLWSLLLSPLIGLIITLCSKSKTQAAIETGLLNQLSSQHKSAVDDIETRLQKLQKMKDNKLITDAEYTTMRTQILGTQEQK